jgi:hypothetical protein
MLRRKRRAVPVRLLSAGRQPQPFPRDLGTPDRGKSQSVRYHVHGDTTTERQQPGSDQIKILDIRLVVEDRDSRARARGTGRSR